MRRSTDCIKYTPIKDNFSFAQRHAFKEFYIEACLKKNILLSDITFTKFNNTLIINLHILFRTKRLLLYRRKLKYKRKLAFKRRRKIKKIIKKYRRFYLRRLKRIKKNIKKRRLKKLKKKAKAKRRREKRKKNRKLKKKHNKTEIKHHKIKIKKNKKKSRKKSRLKKIRHLSKLILILKRKILVQKTILKKIIKVSNCKGIKKIQLKHKKYLVKKSKNDVKAKTHLYSILILKKLIINKIHTINFLKKKLKFVKILRLKLKKKTQRIKKLNKKIMRKAIKHTKKFYIWHRKLKKKRFKLTLSFRLIRKIYKKNVRKFYKFKKNNSVLKKKYLIPAILTNTKYTDVKFRIYPLNYLLRNKDLLIFFKKLRYFQRNIFIRGYYLFLDLIKATTLLLKESISIKTYTFLLGLVLENIHKKKHSMYFRFLKTLLNIMFIYIKRSKKNLPVPSNLLGIKIKINGKLKGKDRANVIRFLKGNLYTSSASAKVHFSRYHAHTKYGVFGLSVWVSYKQIKRNIIIKNQYANQILKNIISKNITLFKNYKKINKKKEILIIKKNLKIFFSFLKEKKDFAKSFVQNFLVNCENDLKIKQFIFQTFIRVYVKNKIAKNILIVKYLFLLINQLSFHHKFFNNKFFKMILFRKEQLKKNKRKHKFHNKNLNVKKTNSKKEKTQRS